MSKKRRVRIVRWCVLLACGLSAMPFLPWPWLGLVVPAMSPYIMVCSAIAARSVSWVSLIGVPVLAISLWRRRWFCRHVCPTGLLVDSVGRLRRSGCRAPAARSSFGQWIVLLAIAGAVVGHPWFLWADPLAMFSASVGLVTPLWICLAVVLVLSMVWPSVWCLRICPLGATQELLALLGKLSRAKWFSARSLAERQELTRRTALTAGLGALWSVAVWCGSQNRTPKAIRPPGSVEGLQFASLCVRCGNCIRACPAEIIHPDLGKHGVAKVLTPVIRFDTDYCREDCRKCTEVCPSGAIRRLSLAEKRATPIGQAEVLLDRCLLSDDRECSSCEGHCPYDAISIVFDEQSYLAEPRIDQEKCTGCGACLVACPTSPKAITVVA